MWTIQVNFAIPDPRFHEDRLLEDRLARIAEKLARFVLFGE